MPAFLFGQVNGRFGSAWGYTGRWETRVVPPIWAFDDGDMDDDDFLDDDDEDDFDDDSFFEDDDDDPPEDDDDDLLDDND